MRSRCLQGVILAGLAGLFGSDLTACQRGGPCVPTVDPSASNTSPPVDPALLAFLSRARSAHHSADLRELENPADATKILLSVMDGPVPIHAGTHPAEAREVLADTAARIADLQSRQLEFDSAIRRLELALRLVPETNYFRGHLFETLGLVEQRRSEHLAGIGQSIESAEAKNRALSAFETSMEIQSEVIRQTTPPDPRPPTRLHGNKESTHDAGPVNGALDQGTER